MYVLRRVTLPLVAVLLLALPSVAEAAPLGKKAPLLLPDLIILAPTSVTSDEVTVDGKVRHLIAFESIAANTGRGPLQVNARRRNLQASRMRVDQVIFRADGRKARRRGIGQLEFVSNPTHNHWHLLTFMRYRLKPVAPAVNVRRDGKNGFCLGDRRSYQGPVLGRRPNSAVYNTNCGPEKRSVLRITEGISVGWLDNYAPFRDGQSIDVTGLPAGDYVLVFRVNPGRNLRERTYRNNAASALVRLNYPRGLSEPPNVVVLQRCERKATCG